MLDLLVVLVSTPPQDLLAQEFWRCLVQQQELLVVLLQAYLQQAGVQAYRQPLQQQQQQEASLASLQPQAVAAWGPHS